MQGGPEGFPFLIFVKFQKNVPGSQGKRAGRVVWVPEKGAFLSYSKIYRVSAERDGDRGAECGDVVRLPERLRLGVPGDPVVVPAGARGPGARRRGGRGAGSGAASPARPLSLSHPLPGSSGCPARAPRPSVVVHGGPLGAASIPCVSDAQGCQGALVCPGVARLTPRRMSCSVLPVTTASCLLLLGLATPEMPIGHDDGDTSQDAHWLSPFRDGGVGAEGSVGVPIPLPPPPPRLWLAEKRRVKV